MPLPPAAQRASEQQEDAPLPRLARSGLRALHVTEDVVYLAVALLLAVGAAVLLVQAVGELISGVREGSDDHVTTVLDTLLLIFILVELLGAVRTTLEERTLLAEPFLIVGLIATIKETIVVAIGAKELEGAAHDDAMVELGLLAALILVLAIAMLLSRRKEREPEEAGA